MPKKTLNKNAQQACQWYYLQNVLAEKAKRTICRNTRRGGNLRHRRAIALRPPPPLTQWVQKECKKYKIKRRKLLGLVVHGSMRALKCLPPPSFWVKSEEGEGLRGSSENPFKH